jgi:hypothetical protein
MIGRVDEVGVSQSGRPKLKINGKWLPAGRLNIDGIEAGSQVSYESGTFKGQNGQDIPCLNSIKLVEAPSANGTSRTPDTFDADELRFISNCVGQAIQAGKCDDPEMILKWAQGAMSALKCLKEGVDSSDIPY